MEVFRRLNADRGITVVLITHEPNVAAYGSRVIQFKDGRVLADTASERPAIATERSA
jgi:putative ABC transport system ATP-binding protein